jgi:hypothetical protein
VESIIVKSANSNTVLLRIREAGLTELFEELSLDITVDVDTWAANANLLIVLVASTCVHSV